LEHHAESVLWGRIDYFFAGSLFRWCGWFRAGHAEEIEDVKAAAGSMREDAVGDLVRGIAANLSATLYAESLAATGEEEAEVVVDFGGGGYGGTRIPCGVFLADGDGRGDAGDLVHIRLFHALEELAGVGGKRLDIAALAFGVDGVKGEGGFAGAADAGDDRKGFVGNFDGDVFQVVDASTAHTQNFLLLEGGSDGFVRGQRKLSQHKFFMLPKPQSIRLPRGCGKLGKDLEEPIHIVSP